MKLQKQPIPIHHFSPEDDLGKLPVRYVALEVHNNYNFSEPHRHNYYEIFFFHRGGGTHLIDFIEYEIPDSSVHIVRPGQVHLLQRSPQSHGAVVHFSKEVAAQLQTAYSLLEAAKHPVLTYSQEAFQTIKTLLILLEAELMHYPRKVEVAITCLNLLLLKSILPESKEHERSESKEQQCFSPFRQLVEAHYRESKLPRWYAAQLHVTEKRLNEACKAATGITVGQYLKDRVLLEAKRLLSNSEGSIKEIGYYLGFEDPAYFTRFFRKNEGITAGDFRSKYK
jgi:AraC family transcriptional regulator, transcriptional activator of pobA